jgi:hypothetical protein
MRLEVDYTFLNNATIILDCLPENDLQTAKRLYDDLIHLDTGINYRKIDSADKLRAQFLILKNECAKGMLPIIHIEAHGNSERGIFVGNKEENFSWNELVESLRDINILTKNNTGVILASCFGLYAISQIKISRPTPFAFLIGSQQKVEAGVFERCTIQFHEKLIKTGSVIQAMQVIPSEMQLFHAEQFYLIAIGKHFRKYMGSRFQKNAEIMVTKARKLDIHNSLADIRKLLKTSLKPSETHFLEWGNRFLHGKITVRYEEFINFLREFRGRQYK